MSIERKNDSIVGKKSYDFSLAIIKLYKNLSTEKKEFILSKQVLRSGTSILMRLCRENQKGISFIK